MNTAFLDASNLAWKIHAVESGFARRDLLKTYESERRSVAETLLDFDNRYAKLFSQKPPASTVVEAASVSQDDDAAESDFIKTFKASCEFTSGYGVFYGPSSIVWSADHSAKSSLIHPRNTKLTPGRIFVNSNVTRVVDANVVHLEQEVPLNGSFRIFIFAGKLDRTRRALYDFAKNLQSSKSFYASYTRDDINSVSHLEKHNPHSHFFTLCTVVATKRQSVNIASDIPDVLARYRQHIYADDRPDRHVPDASASAHAKMGFSEEEGGVVVVRPDGYVCIVVRLVEGSGTVDALNEYFASFCTKSFKGATAQL